MSELPVGDRVVLDALWALCDEPLADVATVRDRAAELGHTRSLSAIRRALGRLVEFGYARRLNVRRGEHGRPRPQYIANRRYGQRIPAACVGSTFLTWLHESRFDWRLWRLIPGDRMVWVDRLGMRATTSDWEWLASRPVLVLDGDPTPQEDAWWEDTPTNPDRGRPPRSPLTGKTLALAPALERARRENLCRAAADREALLANSITTGKAAEALGIGPRAARHRANTGTLLSIADGRRLRFPAWQFDPKQPDGMVDGLPRVLRALRRAPLSDLSRTNWFLTPKSLLGGQTPLEALRNGDHDEVVAEAEALGAN